MKGVESRRATVIGQQLLKNTEILAGILENLNEEEWGRSVPPDARTVGVVVRHLADTHPMVVDIARSVSGGGRIPLTWEGVNEWNAQMAKTHAGCGQADTIAALRDAASQSAEAIRLFTDEQLDVKTENPLLENETTTVAELLHRVLIRHTLWHSGDIQRALIE
jgi:hypothetical protein